MKRARPAKGSARIASSATAKGRSAQSAKTRSKGPAKRKGVQIARGAAASLRRSAAKGGKVSTSALIARRSNGSSRLHPTDSARVVQIKALDPLVACGPHTSVKHLFRLREQVEGIRTVHLVFFDKHGWYCEHGRSCHAVTLVQRAFPHLIT